MCLARPIEKCPLLFAPAMNREMWEHPATQRNVAQIQADGGIILGPDHGDQACGEVGDGRMLEPNDLIQEVVSFFQPKVLQGQHWLVTAGPTFEPIDPVRGITNLSSGKMGFAIARAAQEAGASVTLVAGPVHLPTPRHVQRVDVQTALQMLQAVSTEAPKAQVFVATAAVADWRPAELSEQKIKKNGSKVAPVFELTENPDILASVSLGASPPYCVGFAAESHDLLKHARDKLLRKRLPLVVGNLGPATFGSDHNLLTLVDANGHRELPASNKLSLARQLVAEISKRLHSQSPPQS
jgi:phosphopantothenoylcysteine decarboxylase/phosphopantothenate--cysteine ligase